MIRPKSTTRTRPRRPRWSSAALAVLGVLWVAGPVASGPPRQFVYQVTHSLFGSIGTYINTIEPEGSGTLVLTQAHFDVRVLGVRMYHEVAQRTERWQGNRLVAFDGVTDNGNGPPMVVKGAARGNEFIITSPLGTFAAPWNVHPANPWSGNFLHANEMMRVDNGKVEPVHVAGGETTTVTIGARPIPARQYEIEGSTTYTVWLDSRGIPVKFVVDDKSGKVTFTLAKCVHCGPALVEVG